MPEIRFEAKDSTVAVLDGYCSATGKCRTAFINETGDLIAKPNRPDRCSGVTVRPVGLPSKQLDLLQ